MSKQSKSKARGGSKGGGEKQRSVTQSTSAEHPLNTSAMSVSSASRKSQIGFQATGNFEIDDTTANVELLLAFATKLGALVEWRKIELGDGREVIALCFPLDKWKISQKGSLGVKE